MRLKGLLYLVPRGLDFIQDGFGRTIIPGVQSALDGSCFGKGLIEADGDF